MRESGRISRSFTIVQEKSRHRNMEKLHEMRRFFDDESGILKEMCDRRKIINITKVCACALILSGIYGIYAMRHYSFYENYAQMLFMTVFSIVSGVLINVYAVYSNLCLNNWDIAKRFTASDIMLYWLLDDDEVKAVRVENNGKVIRMICEDRNVRLRVRDYRIVGQGEYATEINMDEKLIVLGNLQ